jgi:taurine dioxygenase
MTAAFTKLGDHMAIAAEGVDLNRPVDAVTAASLRQALHDNLVLCIRGQVLTPVAYREAMRFLGTLMMQTRTGALHDEVPEILILSSEDRDHLGDGEKIVVGAHWHSDDSYKAAPCALTVLYGVEVPATGGDTQFANMYAAYDGLSEALRRRIDGLKVVHKYDSSRKGTRVAKLRSEDAAVLSEVVHPLVRTHPETGRRALYVNPNRMEAIVGMARDESDALLDALTAHATQPQYQYRQRQPGGHGWRARHRPSRAQPVRRRAGHARRPRCGRGAARRARAAAERRLLHLRLFPAAALGRYRHGGQRAL